MQCGAVTESATENRPPAERSTVASRRETCETSSKCTQRLARVKRWGKSPPLRWRHRRQGKPRVLQGQIGGESRPGSIKPSGRLLDPGSDTGTRGMIAARAGRFAVCVRHRIRLTTLARQVFCLHQLTNRTVHLLSIRVRTDFNLHPINILRE